MEHKDSIIEKAKQLALAYYTSDDDGMTFDEVMAAAEEPEGFIFQEVFCDWNWKFFQTELQSLYESHLEIYRMMTESELISIDSLLKETTSANFIQGTVKCSPLISDIDGTTSGSITLEMKSSHKFNFSNLLKSEIVRLVKSTVNLKMLRGGIDDGEQEWM